MFGTREEGKDRVMGGGGKTCPDRTNKHVLLVKCLLARAGNTWYIFDTSALATRKPGSSGYSLLCHAPPVIFYYLFKPFTAHVHVVKLTVHR